MTLRELLDEHNQSLFDADYQNSTTLPNMERSCWEVTKDGELI